jgi:hypothetical protein
MVLQVSFSAPATGGTFTLASGTDVTQPLPYDVTVQALQDALAALPSVGYCSVAQLSPTVWRVTFLEVAGDVPLLTSASLLWAGVTVAVTPVTDGTSTPLSGSVALSYGAEPPVTLLTTASDTDVQAAIESFAGITAVTVLRLPKLNGGALWRVTFVNPAAPLLQFTVDGSGLAGTAAAAVLDTSRYDNAVGGSFRLARHGYALLDTYPLVTLAHDAADTDVAAAVAQLGYPGATVLRSAVAGVPEAYSWSVTFAATAGDVPPLDADGSPLTGIGATVNVAVTQQGAAPEVQRFATRSATPITGGNFTLQVAGSGTTAPLQYNATALDVQAALRALPGMGAATVTRSVTPTGDVYLQADAAVDLWYSSPNITVTQTVETYAWRVTFWDRAGSVPLMRGNSSLLLTDDAAAGVTVERVTAGSAEPLGGSWALVIDGVSSPRIAHDASASEVQAAIAAVAPRGGVIVNSTVPTVNGEVTWSVAMAGLNDGAAAAVAPVITLDKSALQGTDSQALTTLAVTGTTYQKEVQRITAAAASGAIAGCTYGGTPVPAFSAAAVNSSELAAALASLPPTLLGAVNVTLVATVPTAVWDVTFLQKAAPVTPLLCAAAEASVVQVQAAQAVGSVLGGTFTLSYAASTTAVPVSTAVPLAVTALAPAVQAQLRTLPGLSTVTVADLPAGLNGAPGWSVTFTGASLIGSILPLIGDSSGLTGVNPAIAVSEAVAGSEPRGRFALQFNTTAPGFEVRCALEK